MAPFTIEKRATPTSISPSAWVGIAFGALVALVSLGIWIHFVRRSRRARMPTFTIAHSQHSHLTTNLTFLPGSRNHKVAPWPEPVDYQDIPKSADSKSPCFTASDVRPPSQFRPAFVLTPPSPAYQSQSRRSLVSLFSIASTKHSYSTVQKKTYRSFEPLMPDELEVTVGEMMMVIHSYDDGWCVVGRDGIDGEMEVGAVPAWCFAKSSGGISFTRQKRVESLGAQVRTKS